MTLTEYLMRQNAVTKSWINAGPNRMASMWPLDLDHWASYGITTPAQFEAWEARQCLWDLYKSAHGIRPRHLDINNMSDEEVLRLSDECCAILDEEGRLEPA